MTIRVRWWNRLAAWLYERIAEPLAGLATPAWMYEAEAELEEMEDPRWSEHDLDEAYREGRADEARERDGDDVPRPW